MSVYWDLAVKESRELIASAEKSGHEYVGVQRARAIVEVDSELTRLRSLVNLNQVLPFGVQKFEMNLGRLAAKGVMEDGKLHHYIHDGDHWTETGVTDEAP